MGLFDKFKKKKETKKELKLTDKLQKTNVVFKKELHNSTCEEAEEKSEKLKEENNSMDFGVKIGGVSISNGNRKRESFSR